MLTILDKYLLKRYLATFSVMLFLFVPIGIIIDVSEKVNKMIENKVPFIEVAKYYLDFTIYFANILLSKIKNDKYYVITDLRFLHEYEKIKNLDVFFIRIIRPSNINNDLHSSETEYMKIPCDIEIINDGSIKDYINKFEAIIH